ncbi:MAG: GEVED domain-containing protein, partial [Ferruginibacter sp.]
MPCFKASTKILLFILLMCSFESLRAQVIFGEDFESTFPPANWTLFNYSSSNPWEQGAAGTGLNGSRSMAQYTTDVNSDAWIYTRGVTLTSGINYKLSYWYKISPLQVIGKLKVVLTNGVPPTNTTTTTVLHDLSFINNTVYQQGNDVFTVPVSGIYYIGFNAYTSPNQYALHVDSIVLQQTSGATCSGTPPVGTPTAVSTICPDSSFVLSMTGIVAGAGVGYQWQVSDAGQNNFVNIPGGTSEKFTTTQKINKDYRCIATCSFTGLSSTSNIISVTSPAVCYCAPYGSNCTQAAIQNVTFGGINNSSGCGSPTGYSNYATTVAAATVAAGATVPIAVTVGNGQQQYLTVGIDFNKNGSFDAGEVYSVGNGIGQTIFGTIAIPATAPAGITRMRLRIANNYYSPDNCVLFGNGEVEDYSVNITPYICTGTPVPGFMTGPSYVCSGTAFTLNVAGTFTGNVVQWESSPAGANNFTAIPGANTQSLTTSQTSSNDYRCRISCVASGTTAVSTVRAVTTPVLCYCLISNGCINSSYNITNVAFAGINNSSTCLTTGDYTSTVAPATVNAGASTPITVTVAGGTNSSAVAVWIDYNKNGSFEAAEFTAVGTYAAAASFTASVFIASNALPGNTRMRVMRRVGSPLTGTDACNAFAGDIEDYTVNIVAAPIAIYFTPFKDTLYNSTITIRARIVQKDVGINITNPLQPKLWGKRQGTTVWKSFDGQLASGTSNDGNWDFAVNQEVLGLRRNGCDSVQFYFVAQDLNAPPNIGYLPETGAAHSNVNTPVTPPAIPFGYRLKPRMKDTIYVSSGDCRYRSLTAANGLFQDIKTKRLEGNLTILIESDITEDGSHELNKYGINGFTVKIRPASNSLKTIGGNAFYGLIQLDNVKNVLIDGSFNGTGRYLKFDNQETSSMLTDSINVLVIRNSCDSITIRNSIFQHKSYLISPATAGETTLLLKNSNKNIFILNNYFTNNGTSFPE